MFDHAELLRIKMCKILKLFCIIRTFYLSWVILLVLDVDTQVNGILNQYDSSLNCCQSKWHFFVLVVYYMRT
jgi:hypothetical protein